jgi:hypothetical protein
LRVTSRNMV